MGSLCICLLFSQIPVGISFPLLFLFLIFSLFALLIVSVPSQFYLRIASSILHPALLHHATSTFSLILELPPVSQFRFLRKRETHLPHSCFCMKPRHTLLLGSWSDSLEFKNHVLINCVRLLVRSHSWVGLAFLPVPMSRPFLVRVNSVLAEMAVYI